MNITTDAPASGQGTQLVPFHYVMSGHTQRGEVGLVSGVVELDLARPEATREGAFRYVLQLMTEQMGTRVFSVLHFSFERNAL
ncbi:hypothetical protein [Streptomyces sp. NPDC093097]|uniref:hypothetical protein n=1 Tax=Streptomyces sp. NPDC093097 TaxID=3366027 RepID=UPI00381A9277